MIVTTVVVQTMVRIVGESVEANLARIENNSMHDAITTAENNIKNNIVNKPSKRMDIENTVELIGSTLNTDHDKIHLYTESHPIKPDRLGDCSIDCECFEWENYHWAYDTINGSRII